MQKKRYASPELTVLGDLARLTQNGTVANRDAPSGPNNTAYPNAS